MTPPPGKLFQKAKACKHQFVMRLSHSFWLIGSIYGWFWLIWNGLSQRFVKRNAVNHSNFWILYVVVFTCRIETVHLRVQGVIEKTLLFIQVIYG